MLESTRVSLSLLCTYPPGTSYHIFVNILKYQIPGTSYYFSVLVPVLVDPFRAAVAFSRTELRRILRG